MDNQKYLSLIPDSLRRRLKNFILLNLNLGRRDFYSQFGEDAFLQGYFTERKLSKGHNLPMALHPRLLDLGFYIDIGAFHPKFYSNTYRFYQRGWRGVNIDAAPGSMIAFRKTRPQDYNIEAAISDVEKELDFYYWGTPFGVNTFSPEIAAEMGERFGKQPIRMKVLTKRLVNILEEVLPKEQEISFMSVDVEGHDLQVLRSNNWEKYRPELVLAEDHLLLSDQVSGSPITQFMESVGYSWCAWVGPTIVYRDQSKRDFRFSLENSG